MSEQQAHAVDGGEAVAAAAAALKRIDDSWQGWLDALAGIPEERLAAPGAVGEWSVKDVMGHVAFWDEQAVLVGRRHLAGEPHPENDWQAMNEREAAARADRTIAQQRAEMERAHAAVMTLLRTTPPTDPALIGLCGCMKEDTDQHYDEHAAEIRAWRQRTGV